MSFLSADGCLENGAKGRPRNSHASSGSESSLRIGKFDYLIVSNDNRLYFTYICK